MWLFRVAELFGYDFQTTLHFADEVLCFTRPLIHKTNPAEKQTLCYKYPTFLSYMLELIYYDTAFVLTSVWVLALSTSYKAHNVIFAGT